MSDQKEMNYWQNVEDKNYSLEKRHNEFPDGFFDVGQTEKGRRDFLKLMGFGLFVLPVASSCQKIAKEKAIPYLEKNDDVIPGVANWYASTIRHGSVISPVLVKSREGRPIKIEGNPMSPLSQGGISAACQASVLSLYDSSRFKSPLKAGQAVNFDLVDDEIVQSLKTAQKIAIVTDGVHGPTSAAVLEEFKKRYPQTEVILYNPMGQSAEVAANQASFARRDVLQYDLSQAKLVVSFAHDFLNAGVQPVSLTKQYTQARDLTRGQDMLRHVQVESLMSLTGSNADQRVVVSADEQSVFIHNLLFAIQKKAGRKMIPIRAVQTQLQAQIDQIADELWAARSGASAVLIHSQSVADHVKVNEINHHLGNFGKTIYLSGRESVQYENDQDFMAFLDRSKRSEFSHVIFYNTNPFYDFFDQQALAEAMGKVKTKISFAASPDETSQKCDYVVPDRHYLERWADFEVSRGLFSFAQPVIQSLFDNRDALESLLAWSGKSQRLDSFMKELWTQKSRGLSNAGNFRKFWAQCLHDGVLQTASQSGLRNFNFNLGNARTYAQSPKAIDGLKVMVYQKAGVQKGAYANNPWLHELPDPITKATWDNYLMVSPSYAKANSLKTSDVVTIKVNSQSLTLPVLVQPGTHSQVVAVALGYGRTVCGKAGANVGVNANPLLAFENGTFQSAQLVSSFEKTGRKREIAQTQTHHSLEGRDVVREAGLADYLKNPGAGNNRPDHLYSIWKKHKTDGTQWGMSIDLSRCTGCSACIVSCNAENNVPVVGRQEVLNRREMHWIRIDRYYSGDENNPQVVHQPMTCLHCENAPCETVCPTLATVHSSDGLNQQVYNRCVGTRYCANNCPYKVRRFNWFNYARNDELENMVLNPDVTVRSRGVMEKCTMCVQRIQEKRILAKNEKRVVEDGEIQTACQQSCPADAIVFGDIANPSSKITQKAKDPRYYLAIEELGTRPRVGYLTKVRNIKEINA